MVKQVNYNNEIDWKIIYSSNPQKDYKAQIVAKENFHSVAFDQLTLGQATTKCQALQSDEIKYGTKPFRHS